MKRLTLELAAAVSLIGLSARATTVTWVGGETTSGKWNTAANWDTGVVPTSGDVAVFNDKVTLTDDVKLLNGLTISNTATVKIGAKMSGTGDLVKTGAGRSPSPR